MAPKDDDLPYLHGHLPDEDADKLLKEEGDYLFQMKPDREGDRLVLAVKKSDAVHRMDVQRRDGSFNFQNKNFGSMKAIVEHFQKKTIDCGGGEQLQLKRAVRKSKFQLVHKDIKLQKKIGSGAYGTVYCGVLLKENIPVAVKRIDSDGKNEALLEMIKEARVMQMFEHKNIVRFYGFIVDRMPFLLVMELCRDGCLEDTLRNHHKMAITINKRVDLMRQAAHGLEYVHSKDCIHRDIATRNCLLAGEVLKLADFGMCRPSSIYKVDLNKPQNVRWLAPEVWMTAETNKSTDCYAFGIMLWECFEIPYNSPYSKWKAITVKERVMAGYRMSTPAKMPEQVAALMRRCWDHDASKRPNATEIREELERISQGSYDEITQNKPERPQPTHRAKSKLIEPKTPTCHTPSVCSPPRTSHLPSAMRKP
ncbi:TK/FER protein kinase [Aphelenchoides avenae]|nr:TK/FER protein kinase [Aphelenchus avenae]